MTQRLLPVKFSFFSSTLSGLDYHWFTTIHLSVKVTPQAMYGHVITYLSVFPNFKLRDLIAKDPKYGEPCKVDWDENLSFLCEAAYHYALQ